jgi:phosphoribosylanthranilate isomerase
MSVQVKICGIKTKEAVDAAVNNGASFLGFNFYKPSPRYVTPDRAAEISKDVPSSIHKVALLVDANDVDVEKVLDVFQADMLQLHGSETPARVMEIKSRWPKKRIIKAFPIGKEEDFEESVAYDGIADWFLFDAVAPEGSDLPGGNATSFDWNLMREVSIAAPWLLAGGINAKNIEKAVKESGAQYLDIASGVERTRGEKDPALIAELLKKAKQL